MILKLILILILISLLSLLNYKCFKIGNKKSKRKFKKEIFKFLKKFKKRKSLKSRILINNYPLYIKEEVMFIEKNDKLLIHICKECRFINSKKENLKINGAICGLTLAGNEILNN